MGLPFFNKTKSSLIIAFIIPALSACAQPSGTPIAQLSINDPGLKACIDKHISLHKVTVIEQIETLDCTGFLVKDPDETKKLTALKKSVFSNVKAKSINFN